MTVLTNTVSIVTLRTHILQVIYPLQSREVDNRKAEEVWIKDAKLLSKK